MLTVRRLSVFQKKMPRVKEGAELRTLTECGYWFPAESLSDLQMVHSVFTDLHLYVDFYCFPNKKKKRLVYLAGTVPVHYKESEYNIPVCIWLHESHPASRPRCYLRPSVSMVINPSCPCVDGTGIISLDGLENWTQGVSNLSLLVSEMRRAFQKNTPLYSRCSVQALPPEGVQVSRSIFDFSHSNQHLTSSSASQWEQRKEVRSVNEELLGINFSTASSSSSKNPFLNSSSSSGIAPADSLNRMMKALELDGDQRGDSVAPVEAAKGSVQGSGPADRPHQDHCSKSWQSEPQSEVDHVKMAAGLPLDRATIFLSLMSIEGRSYNPSDVMEAVQLNPDFPSALKFLTHSCPICQEQVTFSKVVTMTHCRCFLCQSCFKTFFSAAIKEKSVDQLVCPQCGQPEVRGQGRLEESMDYFNLLDTQIRHFLPPEIHELFQRKLRDRALQDMPNFRWCAHCSFGMLHEADRLRMDCPSCKKSTCCQCRSPWSAQHQGLSCDQFRVWQQQNQPDHHSSLLSYNSIQCPNCQWVFSLSRGGCLHFTCSQCQHQFCGGCSQTFRSGSVCGFSTDCGTRGLHAHHPRDCLYYLRDWSVPRLLLLLQHYRRSPTWLEPANGRTGDSGQTGVCLVLELRDDGSRLEEPCGRPAPFEFRGHCQAHYVESLVELINRCNGDPAVLFSLAEMVAELQRWNVAVPFRKQDEPELLYTHRLRLILTNSIPLKKRVKLSTQNLRPPPL